MLENEQSGIKKQLNNTCGVFGKLPRKERMAGLKLILENSKERTAERSYMVERRNKTEVIKTIGLVVFGVAITIGIVLYGKHTGGVFYGND